ncbi:outer membrane protein assembly factor BamE [Qingshengfaniella alkalisoli]|uniref:Outer membrane protein assembly factor BamE n=1 Tax=Qingshengfaniella alkalisoli TaxID=2599296 RepID=A0A5B8I700_9RHOB|nr:outer membrane protein assembly factor BamE [Qingshengfaniella alkalisoli]QDY69415.1 outer membrane protein assembly factor BamE [Qingshengfaniella alkalisoli]
MKHINGRKVLFALLATGLLPLGHAVAQETEQLNRVDPRREFSTVWRAYPEMDAEYARAGTQLSVDQVRQVTIGQSQDELYQLLGRAKVGYPDGSWEYHLSLPLVGTDRLVCQYRVYFDEEDRVELAVWRRPQCADLVLDEQS